MGSIQALIAAAQQSDCSEPFAADQGIPVVGTPMTGNRIATDSSRPSTELDLNAELQFTSDSSELSFFGEGMGRLYQMSDFEVVSSPFIDFHAMGTAT